MAMSGAAIGLAVALPLYANALVVAARRRGWDLWAAYTPGNAAVGLALVTLTTFLGNWSGALGSWVGYDSVLHGLLAGAVVALPVVGVAWSPTRLGRSVRGAGVGGVTPATLAYRLIVQVLLCTVAFEELAFRGVLYGGLAAAYGSIMAVWGSAASFALWHTALLIVMFADHTPRRRAALVAAGLLAFGLLGLGLAWLRATTGGLSGPLAAHAALDLVMIGGMAAASPRRIGDRQAHG